MFFYHGVGIDDMERARQGVGCSVINGRGRGCGCSIRLRDGGDGVRGIMDSQ